MAAYDLSAFVEDLRAAREHGASKGELAKAVCPLLSRLIEDGRWFEPAMREYDETNRLWRRAEAGFEVTIAPGKTLVLSGEDVHSVHNLSDAVTVSLHVYGMHPDHTDRAQYDPKSGDAARYESAFSE